jgi:hypothetical protein
MKIKLFLTIIGMLISPFVFSQNRMNTYMPSPTPNFNSSQNYNSSYRSNSLFGSGYSTPIQYPNFTPGNYNRSYNEKYNQTEIPRVLPYDNKKLYYYQYKDLYDYLYK